MDFKSLTAFACLVVCLPPGTAVAGNGAQVQSAGIAAQKAGVADLKLKLWGTVFIETGASYAVVEDTQSGKQFLVRQGDAIQGAVIIRILREKVLLSVRGVDQTLEIEKLKRRSSGGLIRHFSRNNFGVTALMDAAGQGLEEEVRLLIADGADVNAQDNQGNTALMYAALRGHSEVVELLISSGADVLRTDYLGNTALIDSAKYPRGSSCDTIALLLTHGADVNARNDYGITALMDAARWGNSESAQCLIANGADVNLKSKSGETALEFAEYSNGEELAELLRSSGAKQ